jgi:hypothetical protein
MKNLKTFDEFINESNNMGYLNNKGAHQKDYDRLYKEYVPKRGTSKDEHGELLRMISTLSNDWYNNHWGNDLNIEIDYLKKYKKEIIPNLKNNKSLDNIIDLWKDEWKISQARKYDEDTDEIIYGFQFDKTTENNIVTWLNDITDAIVLLLMSIQNK